MTKFIEVYRKYIRFSKNDWDRFASIKKFSLYGWILGSFVRNIPVSSGSTSSAALIEVRPAILGDNVFGQLRIAPRNFDGILQLFIVIEHFPQASSLAVNFHGHRPSTHFQPSRVLASLPAVRRWKIRRWKIGVNFGAHPFHDAQKAARRPRKPGGFHHVREIIQRPYGEIC